MTRLALWPIAAVAATVGLACTDHPGPLNPAMPAAQVLTCQADVRARTLACAAPSTAGASSRLSAHLILGGQGIYVALRSSNVSYNVSTAV